MKISQLIKKLERFQKKNGDVPVSVLAPEALGVLSGYLKGEAPILCPWFDGETKMGKPYALVLVDSETAASFTEPKAQQRISASRSKGGALREVKVLVPHV